MDTEGSVSWTLPGSDSVAVIVAETSRRVFLVKMYARVEVGCGKLVEGRGNLSVK